MKLHMVHIPDDADELVPWLESQLVGLHLRELVSELVAIQQPNGDAPPLEELLGSDLAAVIETGLATLPAEKVSRLLQHPTRLLDLHDVLSTHGGAHWTAIQHTDGALTRRAAAGRERMRNWLAETTPTPPIPADAVHPLRLESKSQDGLSRGVGMLLAMAASLAIGFFAGQWTHPPLPEAPQPVPAVAWGWASPGAMPDVADDAQYLNALADAADSWFKKRPETASTIATRISEFRQGCTQLLLADHEPLSAEDRQWLTTRCRAWSEKLDEALSQLEQGDDPIEVRSNVDSLVRQLVETLRARAVSA